MDKATIDAFTRHQSGRNGKDEIKMLVGPHNKYAVDLANLIRIRLLEEFPKESFRLARIYQHMYICWVVDHKPGMGDVLKIIKVSMSFQSLLTANQLNYE